MWQDCIFPIFPDCPQYNFFTSNYEDHCELIDSLDSELIGACWDFGHANLMPYDKAKILDAMGERIKIVHMHNNTEMCDLHIAPCIGTNHKIENKSMRFFLQEFFLDLL